MKILMVCLGNICRSPLAEGILTQKLHSAGYKVLVDSAGTGGWHAGESPDKRSIKVARDRGIEISHQRARKVNKEDLVSFDLIFAMDQKNFADLLQLAENEHRHKIHLFLEFAGLGTKDVPDPWYGNESDFVNVFNLLEKASNQAFQRIVNECINK